MIYCVNRVATVQWTIKIAAVNIDAWTAWEPRLCVDCVWLTGTSTYHYIAFRYASMTLGYAASQTHAVCQHWTGNFFAKTSLRDIGLVVYLGHNGCQCPTSVKKRKLSVCDTSGFHEVNMVFCGCYHANIGFVHEWKQLMRLRWYPATCTRPNTVFTFRVLDFFHELTLQGKLNLYDFHETLDRITSNSGTVASWVSRCQKLSHRSLSTNFRIAIDKSQMSCANGDICIF